jgi:hypothetical protein
MADSAISKRAGKGSEGLSELASSGPQTMGLSSFKRGGKVKRTGLAKVHKGERVLTKKQAKKRDKKKSKGK